MYYIVRTYKCMSQIFGQYFQILCQLYVYMYSTYNRLPRHWLPLQRRSRNGRSLHLHTLLGNRAEILHIEITKDSCM